MFLVFDDFWFHGDRLGIPWLSGLLGGTPELSERTSGMVNDLFLDAVEDHLSSLNASIIQTAVVRPHDSRLRGSVSSIRLTAWWPQGAGG